MLLAYLYLVLIAGIFSLVCHSCPSEPEVEDQEDWYWLV